MYIYVVRSFIFVARTLDSVHSLFSSSSLTGHFRWSTIEHVMTSSPHPADRPRALHEKIGEALRARIADGSLAIGAPVPSESELCREFSVSRGPVRQALSALRAEGIIAGGRGAVARVVGSVPTQSLTSFLSFTEWANSTGRRPGQRTVEVAKRVAGDEAAALLHLEPGEPVVDLLRLRLLDEEPAMIERTSFAYDIGRHLFDFDTDAGSIFAHLSACGIDLVAARHTFDAVPADDVDAELLGVGVGTPLLRERRLTSTSAGRPVEYSDDRYLPGKVTFTVNNTVAAPNSVIRLIPET
ncbi:GntR family transcriptional regulator [Brevibacterium sanguinis]|uniref:GntR family transcriptional regulator n=3 Tax=Brevibacteriaceae TaxID=85019 RepID=A0A366IMU3_9MICO|nr:GntR family transcriptional regulator [Brevibacterium sanguinis]RBP74404.1 GntR family transcriptional regulator [Brevibacterium celere]